MGNKFVIANPGRCIGCGTCMAACMMEHDPIDGVPIPRLTLIKTRTVSVPVGCHHCQDAPCVASCPENVLYFHDDKVLARQDGCIGCSSCELACPYGAVCIVRTEDSVAGAGIRYRQTKRPMPLKCDLCSSRTEGPACVAACLTNGLIYVDDEIFRETARKKHVAAATAAELLSDFKSAPAFT